MKLGIASGDRLTAKRSADNQSHWGGAGWVRLGQYANRLPAEDIEVFVGTLVWNRTHFSIDVGDDTQELEDIDVVYMQRLMHDTLTAHIKEAQAYGQIIINDLDDWYWGLHPTNHAFASSHPKASPNENTNHYKSVLNSSNLVTVSTDYLADRISTFVRCPIVVIPNTIDVARFTPVQHTDTTLPVVGWIGSTNHRSSDLEVIAGIMKPLYDNNEILLMHAGYHHGAPSMASKWKVAEEAVERLRAVDPEQYPSLLKMEVGVAPLSDMPFNHAKSDIKTLEYSASGIPWVASDLPAYRKLHEDWGLGRVAKKPKQWLSHLRTLKDPDIRASEGSALREASWKRDIGVGTKQLAEVLKSLSS
jgi:glycosyltransferase involved in cell wall biosynthesis